MHPMSGPQLGYLTDRHKVVTESPTMPTVRLDRSPRCRRQTNKNCAVRCRAAVGEIDVLRETCSIVERVLALM